MPRFYVVHESTEDTLETTENLEDAIQLAKEHAKQGPVGDLVSILETGGRAVCQFALQQNGTIDEIPITQPIENQIAGRQNVKKS